MIHHNAVLVATALAYPVSSFATMWFITGPSHHWFITELWASI